MDSGLRAGVGRVELRPPLGVPMMGYGARRGTAEAYHDPLYARALYCRSGSGGALLLEADLCLIAVSQAAELRDRIARRTGLRSDEILIGCVHTHSGPETGLLQVLSGGGTPPEVAPLFDAIVGAAVQAVEGAVPAKLGAGRVPVAIGRNRRRADGPLDPDALVLRIDAVESGPLAVLYLHGCHPTALGHDNLAFSGDWPGAASLAIEAAVPGATAIFALGAHADVDPRTRGLLDLAVPDQSIGVGFDEMETLGREVGAAVACAALALTTRSEAPVAAGSTRVPLATHGGSGDDAERREHLAKRRGAALAALDLAPDSEARTAELYRLESERTRGLSAREVRQRLSAVRLYLRDRTAPRIAGGSVVPVEVQVLRFGPVWLLGLPLEVTVDVGREWRESAGELSGVVSIANGWLRYLPHAAHFEEPDAEWKYEILQSTFVPAAAERLLEAARSLRQNMAGDPA